MILPLLVALKTLTPNPSYIEEAMTRWEVAGLDVEVVSHPCGEVNASYTPADQRIEMCTELYANPELAVFVFNHEMGHAFMFQRGIPNSEAAADELGFLMSSDDEVLEGARFFLAMGGSESKDGDHPADLDRAASLLCLLDGRDPNSDNRVCRAYQASVFTNWTRMFILTDPLLDL